MKKSICLVLCLIIVFAFSACKSGNENYENANQDFTDVQTAPNNADEPETGQNPIGKETLQYPSQDDIYTYDVYESYAEVTGCVNENLSGEITIPETFDDLPILSIKSLAFYNQNKITGVNLPENLYQICSSAFQKCSKLNIVNFGEGIERILDSAFSETNIHTIAMPASVVEIGDYCFAYCDNLSEIIMSDSVTEIPIGFVKGNLNLKSIEFSSFLISIGEHAFTETGFEFINLPNSLQTIGEWAFTYMPNLKEFKIPDNVTELNDGFLMGCENLEKVTIGKSVTSIPNWAFAQCGNLKEIVIPSNVKSISSLVLNENAVYNNGDLYSRPVIYGVKGSAAANFASSKGLSFKLVENQ